MIGINFNKVYGDESLVVSYRFLEWNLTHTGIEETKTDVDENKTTKTVIWFMNQFILAFDEKKGMVSQQGLKIIDKDYVASNSPSDVEEQAKKYMESL